ncbi:unnamed protein product [Closterium sp. Yama58-4]|nr:unnamed protein product [Closterium sp. Yama58-4]
MKFLATTLDGCDVLLGRDWLRRHNPVIDWTTGSCCVSKHEGLIKLPAWTPDYIQAPCVKAITIAHHFNRGAQLFAVCLRELAVDTDGKDIEKLCAAVPPDLAELIRQYPDIFPDDLPLGLPPERPEDHKIQLEPGAQPTVRTQWRLTQPELEELRRQIDALLEKGFIRPSTSPFAAPILFTPKKDGGLRMCIDYRALNRVTIKSRYPIPRTDDLLDQLRGARYFSKIDLRGGYHQIRVFADDCHKTAFRTRYGSYEFTVMPFGLTNAPSTFQLTMNRVFRDLLDRCVIVYLDDILIFSKTREQHLRDLDAVFKRLQENRLITKGSKCEFFKQELEFLGHVISRDGIKIDPAKIKTIQEWKAPTNVTELQSFLGFVNYVRRFIPNMAGITGPLTDLLHKDKNFVWGEEAEAAFQELKNFLVSPPVLRIADPSKPFEVVTDASDFAIGAVLLQDFGNGLQPIAYESRKLQAAERNYPIHDKEMLAIIHAFKLWRCYLVGADVTVRTDHKSLQYLRAQLNLNPRQIRWLDYMESHFTYRITYKKGANNIADALTRPTVQSAAVLITHSNPLLTGLFTHGYTTDPFFTTGNHQQATTQKGDYYLKAGTDRIWVPAYRLLRELLIQEVHDSNYSGHFGVDKTQKLLHRQYYWQDSSNDVQRYVSSCRVCQAMKSTRQRPAGLLQPLEPPERPWQQVTMDFVTGMPAGPSGNDAVLVVVDRFTKMAHFAPCRTTITAEETARLFISTVVRLHGIPSAIITDRDPKFTSKFWKETWAQYGTKLQFSSAYHPQTDGQTERTNQTMEQLIRTNCPDPARWEDSLAMLEFAFNNAPSSTTNHSPFFLNYGMDPTVPTATSLVNPVPRSQTFVMELQNIHEKAADAIRKANTTSRKYTDLLRRELVLTTGQLVLLDTKNLHLPGPSKLRPRFCGPFKIIKMVTPVTAKLLLPEDRRIHDAFHVSLLRKFVPATTDIARQQAAPTARPVPEPILDPSKILAHRVRLDAAGRHVDFLIRWTDRTSEDDTWVPSASLDASPLVGDYLARKRVSDIDRLS